MDNFYKSDGVTLDAKKVCFTIWEKRNDPATVKILSRRLSKKIDEQTVFDDIEFYLPQIAHMSVHLTEEDALLALERLTAMICLTSAHLALQLSFIYMAAMEDYQPELPDGRRNPTCDPVMYARCALLLQNVERCFIYGSVGGDATQSGSDAADSGGGKSVAATGNTATNGGSPGPALDLLTSVSVIADKKVLSNSATRIASMSAHMAAKDLTETQREKAQAALPANVLLSGTLLYKRVVRKSMFVPKRWKSRFFCIVSRVLMCYRDSTCLELLRAIPLQECSIVSGGSNSKHAYYFEVVSESMNMRFMLRASDALSMRTWTTALQCESALPVTADSAGYSTAGRRLSIMGKNRAIVHGRSNSAADNGGRSQNNSGSPIDRSLSACSDSNVDDQDSVSIGGVMATIRGRDSRVASSATNLSSEYDSNEVILTTSQEKRYEFFKSQKHFIRNLTDICERLRFVDKPLRATLLRHSLEHLPLPSFCYLPLCKSTDPWRYVLTTLPEEGVVFTTKARVPVLMFFEVEEHPEGIDVASFLALQLAEVVGEGYDDDEGGNENGIAGITKSKSEDSYNNSVEARDSIGGLPPPRPRRCSDVERPAPANSGRAMSFKAFLWADDEGGGGSNARTLPPAPPNNQATQSTGAMSFLGGASTFGLGSVLAGRVSRSPSPSGSQQDDSSTGGRVVHRERALLSRRVKKSESGVSLSSADGSGGIAASTPKRLSIWKSGKSRSSIGTVNTTAEDGQGSSALATGVSGKESFGAKAARIRYRSPFSNLSTWKLDGVLAKSNDDVRQEVFVMQLIMFYSQVFKEEGVGVWLHPYRIVSTSKTTGLIQLIPDAISIDGLKKMPTFPGSLSKYYQLEFNSDRNTSDSGGENSVPAVDAGPHPLQEFFGADAKPAYMAAIDAYIQSLAAYSVVAYLLAIKDRHNGNVMLDSKGHIIHIDFGFVFGLAPGKQFSMETAPWKLTKELVEVMLVGSGLESTAPDAYLSAPLFQRYTQLCTDCFMAARKHASSVTTLMSIMAHKSQYPAFRYNPRAIQDFTDRLKLDIPDSEVPAEIRRMIITSYDHSGANRYDTFQVLTNGIAK